MDVADDNFNADAPKQSRTDRKKDKYAEQTGSFSIANDSKITDGPVADRSCTDIICLGVFIAFLVMMISFTGYGFAEGDVKKYIAPVSGGGDICGFGTMVGKDHLRFPVLVGEIFDNAECVAACPSGTLDVLGYCIPTFQGKGESD